jgi:alpha-D-ribose 1-methylphosphonate 5-triphosphate diphosphatase
MMENGITPSSAINMLTLNPARHLGRDREIGSIEVGKVADLAAFHARSGFGDVVRVWVGGEERFRTPVITTNETNLAGRAELLQNVSRQ